MLEFKKYFNDWKFIRSQKLESVFDDYCMALDYLGYDEKECQKILRSIIKKFPESHIDAYNHMSISLRNQKKTQESLHYALTAYLLGKSIMPTDFKHEQGIISWSDLDNRPFLRSCQTLGLEFQYHKNFRRAIEIYTENLNYNPNDNQGIRYLLLDCYFQIDDFKNIQILFNQYPDDWSVEFLYGKVIFDVLRNNSKKVKEYWTNAYKCNKFVATEVIKNVHKKPEPFRLPGEPFFDAGIPVGSVQEAYDYWSRNKRVLGLRKIKNCFESLLKTIS